MSDEPAGDIAAQLSEQPLGDTAAKLSRLGGSRLIGGFRQKGLFGFFWVFERPGLRLAVSPISFDRQLPSL
jgi:hypothetical protein